MFSTVGEVYEFTEAEVAENLRQKCRTSVDWSNFRTTRQERHNWEQLPPEATVSWQVKLAVIAGTAALGWFPLALLIYLKTHS